MDQEVRTGGPGTVRVTELLALISLGTDLGMGLPMEHAIRQSLLAVRLGERAGLDEAERAVVYYASLLAWVGCHVDAYEQAKWFGDDHSLKADIRDVDVARPVAALGYLVRHLGAGRPVTERLRLAALFLGDGRRALGAMFDNHWRAAVALIDRLDLGDAVRDSVAHTFERWDGKGAPFGVTGDDIAVSSRIVNIADVAEVFHGRSGVAAARQVVRERRGTQFDPELADLFCREAESLFAELDSVDTWAAALTAEPLLDRVLVDRELDQALEAVADFVDLKSPYTLGHSRSVARLAADAATALGLRPDEVSTVYRAGLVHDLGRLGVSNAVWDKPGALTASERERVRLHPYLTERMLASSPSLAHLADVAGQHHERLDGSGYPRGLTATAISLPSRLLAAADLYRSRVEPRPHRAAASRAEATTQLRAEVTAGRLDGEAVAAVLGAAGDRPVRRAWPAGLTTREVEVLRLVACGLSTKEVAAELSISAKTASNHIERIYLKIGASNRAMAGVFAAQHGLSADPTR